MSAVVLYILVFKSVNLLNLGQCTILNLSRTSRSTVLFVDERKLTPNYLHWPFDVTLSTEAMVRRQGHTYRSIIILYYISSTARFR